ncbi:MAG: hypothetical protein ACKO96_24110 [Flammeovirgaceae bacterium]
MRWTIMALLKLAILISRKLLVCQLLWRKQYSRVSLHVRKQARPRQACGGAGGPGAEQGAHKQGAWPPPLPPRRGIRRP